MLPPASENQQQPRKGPRREFHHHPNPALLPTLLRRPLAALSTRHPPQSPRSQLVKKRKLGISLRLSVPSNGSRKRSGQRPRRKEECSPTSQDSGRWRFRSSL